MKTRLRGKLVSVPSRLCPRLSCDRRKYEHTGSHRRFQTAAPRVRHVRSGVVGKQSAARDRDVDVRDPDRDLFLPATKLSRVAAASGPTHGHAQAVATTWLRNCEYDPAAGELYSD